MVGGSSSSVFHLFNFAISEFHFEGELVTYLIDLVMTYLTDLSTHLPDIPTYLPDLTYNLQDPDI